MKGYEDLESEFVESAQEIIDRYNVNMDELIDILKDRIMEV